MRPSMALRPRVTTPVVGHEIFGRVEEVGSGVSELAVGDYVVATVRRLG